MNSTPPSTTDIPASGFNATSPPLASTNLFTHDQRGSSPGYERALVLHGGGSAGNAWEIGVIAGLFDAGLDVTTADLTVGTSAGATAAAQITSGTSPIDLFEAIVAAPPATLTARNEDVRRDSNAPVANYLDVTSEIIARASDPADMRRLMGAAALELDEELDASSHARWRATVASRLPRAHWPEQHLLIVAVDAYTGEPVVFDRNSGVDLVDAIAASCASGFGVSPYPIGDSRYIDGGYRRSENADLAAGYERVLVLSPFGGHTRMPRDWNMHLSAQVEELRAHGSLVETVFPDESALAAFGTNMMNLAARPPAARAGYDQGRALGEHLAQFWR
jgi:NTE family protein